MTHVAVLELMNHLIRRNRLDVMAIALRLELMIELVGGQASVRVNGAHPRRTIESRVRHGSKAVTAAICVAAGKFDPTSPSRVIVDMRRYKCLRMMHHADQHVRHFVDCENAQVSETCIPQGSRLLLDRGSMCPGGRIYADKRDAVRSAFERSAANSGKRITHNRPHEEADIKLLRGPESGEHEDNFQEDVRIHSFQQPLPGVSENLRRQRFGFCDVARKPQTRIGEESSPGLT